MSAFRHTEPWISRGLRALPSALARLREVLTPSWIVVAALVLLCVWEFASPIVQADDAFISYRYALNLASGNGLVFNPGERVEGFTNLLWTLLIAGGIRLGIAAPAMSQAMSVIFAAGSLVLTFLYTRRFLPQRFQWLAPLAPAVLLASNSFACWMSTGLETPLFLFLTVAALLSFDMNRPYLTAVCCTLAFLTRPEGGIEAAVLLGWQWLARISAQPLAWRRMVAASLPPLIFAVVLLLVTIFRLVYFGDWVPNTFHAKVGQVPAVYGEFYIWRFLNDGNLLLLPGATVAPLVVWRLRIPTIYALATVVYCWRVGGDVFAFGRFLLPCLPVLLAGATAAPAWMMSRAKLAGLALAALPPATALASLYLPYLIAPSIPYDAEFQKTTAISFPKSVKRAQAEIHYFAFPDEKRVVDQLADEIRRAKPDAKLIACIGIGKFAYYHMEFTILDMVGLVDRHVAQSKRVIPQSFIIPGHSRTDSDYVLSRKPDVIILPNLEAAKPGRLPAELDLLRNPELPRQYRFVSDGGFWVRR